LIIKIQFVDKKIEVDTKVELIADEELSKHVGIGKITSIQLNKNIDF